MPYTVMAHIVMVHIVMVHIAMAYIVMAPVDGLKRVGSGRVDGYVELCHGDQRVDLLRKLQCVQTCV